MAIIITGISILLIIGILSKRGQKQLALLIFGAFLFSPEIILFRIPIEMPFKRALTIALLIYWFNSHQKHRFEGMKFPLSFPLALMFLGSIILITFDSRFGVIYNILYPLLDALDTYFILYLGYFFWLKSGRKIENLLKPLIICCLIVQLYGICELIIRSNPIQDIILHSYLSESSANSALRAIQRNFLSGRNIVFSLYRYSFDYGFNSGLMFMIFLYFIFTYKKEINKRYLLLFLSFIGVVICGSRTVLITAIISIIIFLWFSGNANKKKSIIFGTLCLLLLSYIIVPPVKEMVDLTLETVIFQKGETHGSSVSMRTIQFLSALNLVSKNIWFGNGFKYILLELDWKNHKAQDGMAGYESIVFQLLIERGLIGIIIFSIFFICIIRFFYKNRKNTNVKNICALGISITIFFIVFSCGTGPLDAWFNTMLIDGFLIGEVMRRNHYKAFNHNKVLLK